MRLIDADVFEVISLQGKSEEFCNGVMWMLEQIDNQPTAYDIDKVVEELEVERFRSNYEQEQVVYDKAIEIVNEQLKENK